MLVAATGCLLGAAVLVAHTCWFLAGAVSTVGEVVEVREERGSEGDRTHRTVFTYRDSTGLLHRSEAGWTRDPPTHRVGEALDVLYDAKSPDRVRIDGFVGLWLAPSILAAVGLVALLPMGLGATGAVPLLARHTKIRVGEPMLTINGVPVHRD